MLEVNKINKKENKISKKEIKIRKKDNNKKIKMEINRNKLRDRINSL